MLIDVTTVGDVLVRASALWPSSEAVVFPDDRLTYKDLFARACGIARSLVALGVRKGTHVGILLPNSIEFVASFFGAALVGAVIVPVNTRFKAAELAYVIENSDISVLLTTDVIDQHADFLALLGEGLPGLEAAIDPIALSLASAPKLKAIVNMGSKPSQGVLERSAFDALGNAVAPEEVSTRRARCRVRDVAVIMYTSGTTAHPKGAMLTHESLVRSARAIARHFALTPDDRWWGPLPMFHAGGIFMFLAVLDSGGRYMSSIHFDASEALEMMAKERATIAYPVFPTITQDLINHPLYSNTDLLSVRATLNVAPPDLLERMQKAWPTAIQISAFGSTETGGVVCYNGLMDDLSSRTTTVGRPFPGLEVRIVDLDSGGPKGPGEIGELLVRGYSLFEGYYRDPAKTSEAIDTEGWFHTGDLAALDDQGQLSFHGRTKDMLKVGGENVAATEIESFLCTHPAVCIAQVVGAPDQRLTEVPAAFVELLPGQSVTGDELISFCTGKIASFKVPRYVRFVTEWPMSATKIQKFRLRDELLEELELA